MAEKIDPNATPAKGLLAKALKHPFFRDFVHMAGGSMNWRYVTAVAIVLKEDGSGYIEATLQTWDSVENKAAKRILRLPLDDHPLLMGE